MLAATVTAAAGQGFTDRMGTIEADLERPWPASATADLMWASSSLHELRDPERTMGEMYAALNPGGLLVVMEMDSLPSFLPTELGDDAAGLDKAAERGFESRLHAAMSQQGWNVHPDWRPGLERAGFKVIEQRSFHTKRISAHEPIGRFAANFFGRIRLALADAAISGETLSVSVSTQDLATLDVLLSGVGPRSLLHRRDLQVRGRRKAWAAFKP